MNLNEDQSRRIRELESDLRQTKAVVEYFQTKLEIAKNEHAREKADLIEEVTKGREQQTQELQMIKVIIPTFFLCCRFSQVVLVLVLGSSSVLFD